VLRHNRVYPLPGAQKASPQNVVHSVPPATQVIVAQKVASGVYKGVTTHELDELAAETAASMTATHPDYAVVSAKAGNANRGPARPYMQSFGAPTDVLW